MRRTAFALLFLLSAAAAYAGDPPPDPSAAPVMVAPVPAPTVAEIAPSVSAAIVPAPSGATTTEIREVAEQSQENLKAVANGEVSLAAATRDPTSGAPDPGSGGLFWLLAIVFGTVIRPLTDIVVGRLKSIDDDLAAPLNTAVLLATYIGAWALLHAGNPDLPQSVTSWVIAGFAAAGLGSATTKGIRSIGNRTATP